jgi:hypothetical protein
MEQTASNRRAGARVVIVPPGSLSGVAAERP